MGETVSDFFDSGNFHRFDYLPWDIYLDSPSRISQLEGIHARGHLIQGV